MYNKNKMRGGTRNDRIEHYLFTSQQFKGDRPLLYRGSRADSLERDGQLYYFKLQQRILGICQYDDGRPLASGVCMSLNCENTQQVDQEYQRLQSLGIKTQGAPARHPKFPVYSFFFADPDGYLLEFQKIVDEE